MSTGQPRLPKQPQKRLATPGILPQNIELTDAEEAALDEVWAEIAAEDPDAAESMRHDGESSVGKHKRTPGH